MTNSTDNNHPYSFLVAAVDAGLVVIYAIAYIPCIFTIILNEKFYKHASYKIILLMAFFDMIQLVVTGPVTAIYQMTSDLQLHQTEAWGAVAMFAYFGYMLALAILSVERFCKILFVNTWQVLYDGRRVYFWLIAPVLLGCSVFLLLLVSKDHSGVYNNALFTWHYLETPKKAFIYSTDHAVTLTAVSILTFTHICIFMKLHKMSQLTTGGPSNQERQILYQCFMVSTAVVVCQIIWHGAEVLNPTIWINWICHLAWINTSGINGIVYLTFNKTMRDTLKSNWIATKVHPIVPMVGIVETIPRGNQINSQRQ